MFRLWLPVDAGPLEDGVGFVTAAHPTSFQVGDEIRLHIKNQSGRQVLSLEAWRASKPLLVYYARNKEIIFPDISDVEQAWILINGLLRASGIKMERLDSGLFGVRAKVYEILT